MRIWNVNPKLMCRKHLLGEHVELHMLVGSMNRHKSIQGFIEKGLIQTNIVVPRHNELVKEIERRGYNHKSPIIIDDNIAAEYLNMGLVDSDNNLKELARRCNDCCAMQSKYN